MTDIASVLLIIKLVASGVGVVRELADLAKRVQAGEEITEEDIKLEQAKIKDAVARWNAQETQ